jgi:hypothetical protein
MNENNFSFPRDIPLFLVIPFKILYFRSLIQKEQPEKIISRLKNRKKSKLGTNNQLGQMQRTYRMVSHILVKTLHNEKPCMIRSFILYEKALKLGLDTELCISVAKDNEALTGHSWIEIKGDPFMENSHEIAKYSVMIRG